MLKKTLRQRRNKAKKMHYIVDEVVSELKPAPKLISTWKELQSCRSETHILEIDVRGCNGWIHFKNTKTGKIGGHSHYLSTHTFYGTQHEYSTKLLQQCGFNVVIANWDEMEG